MQIKLVSYRKLPSSSTKSKPQQVVFTGGSKIAKTKYQLGLTASYTKDFQWRQREPNPFPRKKPCSRKHILLEVVNAAVVLMHTYTCVRLWLLVCWAIPIAMWLHIYRKHSSTFKLWDEMYTIQDTQSLTIGPANSFSCFISGSVNIPLNVEKTAVDNTVNHRNACMTMRERSKRRQVHT